MIHDILKRWMYAQMYGAKTSKLKRIGIAFFLWHYLHFPWRASWYQANNASTLRRAK